MVLTKTKENTEARQPTSDTWSISGLDVLRVINESNTAVIAHELHKKEMASATC